MFATSPSQTRSDRIKPRQKLGGYPLKFWRARSDARELPPDLAKYGDSENHSLQTMNIDWGQVGTGSSPTRRTDVHSLQTVNVGLEKRKQVPSRHILQYVKWRTGTPKAFGHGGGGDSPHAPCEPMQGWRRPHERWLQQSPLHRPAESFWA